ncbi:serine hydrolase domain-containing protein [Marinicella litoralis]|uniref:CubicO group peptidase (Beta-lactamase class C family) n=1 Tax=Marinicella litoralis TaxID=644220 RepID=A0A4R6XB35_9GAMM|nr:serine hydrolase domain-containing protein [Marinicella litoralis]TDR16376.1 CubicO group peptidase (beta-lactamase class C family) [Marinicella litoralis]
MKYTCVLILFLFSQVIQADITDASQPHREKLDQAFLATLQKHKLNTIGVAVIKSGQIQWTGHYGQQAPGIPASETTLFDVGSITKLVTTQTVLQLVQAGKINLDEPMSEHWVDPDIIDDERHLKLTPRMVLTHSTGFANWRFFSEDRKLKFINPPGTHYSYSGEGFQYLAKFIENKLDTSFEALAQEYVFTPAGMSNVSMSVNKALYHDIAQALDKGGEFYGHYCRPGGWCSNEGTTSVAGSMVITVQDLSRFLIWSMNNSGLNSELQQQINTIKAEQPLVKGFQCEKLPNAHCPSRQGYGLGWNVTEFKGGRLIGHGGSDWSLITLAYYYPATQDGVVILLNGPSDFAMKAMINAITILDPSSPKLHEYLFRSER